MASGPGEWLKLLDDAKKRNKRRIKKKYKKEGERQ
jgi:hypothetical protein